MSKLQKVVTASEQDRIVLSERLEAAKGAITELKKQLGTQGEKVSGLNRVNEDSELRRLELETQIKTNKQVSEIVIVSNLVGHLTKVSHFNRAISDSIKVTKT